VTDPSGQSASPPDWTPPFGTNQRIRVRAIWAVALFASSVPPAIVGMGIAATGSDEANVAMPLAFGFWAIGLLMALWAAFPTLRYWESLSPQIRWLGALPLLTISLFFTVALIAAIL
jgi:hypothetical protein